MISVPGCEFLEGASSCVGALEVWRVERGRGGAVTSMSSSQGTTERSERVGNDV